MTKLMKYLNWSEISRFLTGSRHIIRSDRVPEEYIPGIDKIIREDIPAEWEEMKVQIREGKK